MSYQQFASVLSVVVVLMYAVLIAIATRRARFNDRRALPRRQEDVAVHARFVEGPMWTVLFLFALGTMLAAFFIGTADYARIAALLTASVRGGLFCLGGWALAWYWRQRATWL